MLTTQVRLNDTLWHAAGSGARDDEPRGRWLRVAIKLAFVALLGLGVWWVAIQLHKPAPPSKRQIQRITIVRETPPPPEPLPEIVEAPATRSAPDLSFERPAPRPESSPAPEPEEVVPVEHPPEPPPGPAATPRPGSAIAQENSPSGELSSGAPGPGAGGTGTGNGAGAGSSPARWDAAHLGNAKPAYPHLARARGHEGTALLLVLVNAAGLPSEVRLKQSSGSNLLDRSALEAVQTWRFVPAQENGKPVATWLLIPVVFSLQG